MENTAVYQVFNKKMGVKGVLKKLFFFLLGLFEGLDHNNLGDALDQFETLVNDPSAPEEPAAVISDACRKVHGCLTVIHGDLDLPARHTGQSLERSSGSLTFSSILYVYVSV